MVWHDQWGFVVFRFETLYLNLFLFLFCLPDVLGLYLISKNFHIEITLEIRLHLFQLHFYEWQ